MKRWGRYEVVGSPSEADIVIELQYRPYSNGNSYGVYNQYTKTMQSYGHHGADFALVIYDAKSKEQLWSVSDEPGSALLVSNQRKEVVKSINRLISNLKSRM
jgi:hypothetical protein